MISSSAFIRRSWLCVLGSLVLIISACRKENSLNPKDSAQNIYFSSTIQGLPQTRVSGTAWGQLDSIGISMFQNGVQPASSSIVNNGLNIPYVTNGNGNFSPKDAANALQFPTDGKVDFIAYYPYRQSKNLTLDLSVADQTNQSALDFMVARNLSGTTSGSGPVSLAFERQMTKVELKVVGTAIDGLKAAFQDIPAKATFDLAANELRVGTESQNVEARVYQNTAKETIVEWTLFPLTTKATNKIVFTKADGTTYTWKLDADTKFEKGNRYQYNVTLGKDGGVDPQPTTSYMELPVISPSDNIQYSLKISSGTRRNYSMLYDTEYKVAYWVAYPLSGDYLGSQDRTDDFGYDPDFAQNFQADLSKGYPNNSALDVDRGHQIPSGDRTANYQENAATFYSTNMTPQVKSLNQGIWAELENKVRTWTTQSGVDTMYVVTGAMITTATDKTIDYVKDNSGKQVAKPKYYYKALAMKKGEKYYTIGFRMDNVKYSTKEYMNYTTTVDALEKETGFTFFPALDKSVKETIDTNIWRK